MLVLDSNTISSHFGGDPAVVPQLQALRPAELGVPAIVEHELRCGLPPSPHACAPIWRLRAHRWAPTTP
jgi:tRNA(fMet)-specific endonuclease VapC